MAHCLYALARWQQGSRGEKQDAQIRYQKRQRVGETKPFLSQDLSGTSFTAVVATGLRCGPWHIDMTFPTTQGPYNLFPNNIF